MVLLSPIQEAELKGKRPIDALAMTKREEEGAGQMFRLQLPIFHDPNLFATGLREQADLLNGLALQMRLAADAAVTERHINLYYVVKGHIRHVNNMAKLPRFGGVRKSDDPDETQ
jgi:hypothetical protein